MHHRNDRWIWTLVDAMAAKTQETFGQRLARLRKERGITQVELAEHVEITQPVISSYERDFTRPSIDTIVRLAKVLKLSTDELLLGQKTQKAEPTVSRKILKRVIKIQGLPRRDQDALLRTIDAFLSKSA